MFAIGVDLGQRRDFSAVAVVERVPAAMGAFDYIHWRRRERAADEWVVRHLERIPLGTPYTEVTARIVEIARDPKLGGDCQLVVDATGVGMPVVDLLRTAGPGCAMAAVWITGGAAESFDGKIWHVPKLDLLARVQTLLEQKRLRIAGEMPQTGTLVRELVSMTSVRRASGRLRVGAASGGEHDDLALAVALAVWSGRLGKSGGGGGRLPGM